MTLLLREKGHDTTNRLTAITWMNSWPEYLGRTNSWPPSPAMWKSGASPRLRETLSPSCMRVFTQLLTVKQLVSRQSRACEGP